MTQQISKELQSKIEKDVEQKYPLPAGKVLIATYSEDDIQVISRAAYIAGATAHAGAGGWVWRNTFPDLSGTYHIKSAKNGKGILFFNATNKIWSWFDEGAEVGKDWDFWWLNESATPQPPVAGDVLEFAQWMDSERNKKKDGMWKNMQIWGQENAVQLMFDYWRSHFKKNVTPPVTGAVWSDDEIMDMMANFALAYHKAANKDISNDVAEYYTDKCREKGKTDNVPYAGAVWVKATPDNLPRNPKDNQRFSAKYKGEPQTIIYSTSIWDEDCWCYYGGSPQSTHYKIQSHEWEHIEILSESPSPIPLTSGQIK